MTEFSRSEREKIKCQLYETFLDLYKDKIETQARAFCAEGRFQEATELREKYQYATRKEVELRIRNAIYYNKDPLSEIEENLIVTLGLI